MKQLAVRRMNSMMINARMIEIGKARMIRT